MPRIDDHPGDVRRTFKAERRRSYCRLYAVLLKQAKYAGPTGANTILVVRFIDVIPDRNRNGNTKLINRVGPFVALGHRHLSAFFDVDDDGKCQGSFVWPT